jgi:hypothetical protein
MSGWLIFGIWLAGCGAGALLTAILSLRQVRKLKAELQRVASGANPGKSRLTADSNNRESERRSA